MNAPPTCFLPHIARMQGYVPGEQPREGGYIKLNTNENPYPPSPLVLERLRRACGPELRVYPDAHARALRRKLSEVFDISSECTMVGNGSDELLNIILRCFAGPGDKVVYPCPTYAYYAKLVQLQDARAVEIDFAEDYSLPGDIAVADARLTLIANPNSPSGTLLPRRVVEELAAQVRGLLVVDEAYADFAAGGCIDLIERHRHLIVVRTLSKSFSLAGMRLGFCFAAPELIAGMWKVKDHYNVGHLGLVAAEAALDDLPYMRANAARIARTRRRLSRSLRELGFAVFDSAANFVLARIGAPGALHIYRELKERRILVRHFSQLRLEDCLRISVGTEVEIDALLAALGKILRREEALLEFPPGS